MGRCVKSWENLTSIACTLAHLTLYCSHFTLGNPKKSFFNSIIHAYLIIYVISEENKLLLPYPPHLKNITTLPCKMQNFFIWLKVMLRSTTLCCNSACRNKTLPKLVRFADWYSIGLHTLLWVLQHPHSAVPSSSLLSLEQKSTDSTTETCCWCRNCYQQSAALLETWLSSIKTMRQHIMLVTQSSFCAMRHPSSSVLVASQQSWPQPGRLPRLMGHAARVLVSSMNPQYRRVAEAHCWHMGWISPERGGLCSWSAGEKDWKHVSVQKVVNLNTCCDVACLTFQFSHITTGSFQSHQCLEERNITFSRVKKFRILQGSVVTFFRCGK